MTPTDKQDLPPGDVASFRVCVVDAFPDGLGQDGHVSGVVGEHGGQAGYHREPGTLPGST